MPLPTSIADLSQTPSSNSPAGSESPTLIDDYLQTYAAYIAQLRDGNGFLTAVRSNNSGTASVPAFSFVGDTNTGFYRPAADTIAVSVNGAEAVRVDASGRLLVGNPSPLFSEKLLVAGTGTSTIPTNLNDLNGALINISGTQVSTGFGGIGYSSGGGGGAAVVFGRGTNYDTQILFCTNPASTIATGAMTERVRITSGGDLLVGTTSNAGYRASFVAASGTGIYANGPSVGAYLINSTSVNETISCVNSATTGNNAFAAFYTEATPTQRGSITYNRAGGLVAYNTTSDYRAKDILGPVAKPGATIDALKVYTGKMKGATQERPMLVAHEAQEHAPYAVSGVKDEVNEDGTPKYQQMDHASLVPLLIAEIQSLRARVAALEAN